MRQLILFAAVALLGVSEVQAQTVSIVNMDTSRDAILLEATLKRFLRDDGYTVSKEPVRKASSCWCMG